MKKALLFATPFSLAASVALAGYVQPSPVTIQLNPDGSGAASGDFVTARYSDDSNSAIGCGTTVYPDGAGGFLRYGYCQASDAAGNYVACASDSPDLLDQARALASNSYVRFVFDADGQCLVIRTSTQSLYLPAKNVK
jgi:hypothetical protein